MSSITSSLLVLILAVPVGPVLPVWDSTPVPTVVAQADWQPEAGDRVIVDTQNNEGYLIHADGRYLQFPVVTGQRRHVYYIGRSYNATTPTWDWTAQSMDIKGDRVTFGKTGRFLRLYTDDERTAYGFHEHRDEEEMFSGPADTRYRSMGCIIVQHETMNLLVQTFEANGYIDVVTVYGQPDLAGLLAAAETEGENL